jgi:hypothetical protein
MCRFFMLFIVILLAACDTGGTPTPALRGAVVPTRATPTHTPTATPTFTLTPSPTATLTSTLTASPTLTTTNTDTPTSTFTSLPTSTATFTPTATTTASATPEPTEIPPDATPTLEARTGQEDSLPIAYGDTVTGTINDETPRVFYSFTGSAGEPVNIRMNRQSGDLDPYLKLLDSSGSLLAENDDDETTEGSRDSYINGFELPADGVYTVMATRFQEELGTLSGDFTLTLTTGVETAPTEGIPDGDNVLTYGDVVRGTINESTSEVEYTFEGSAGDRITIRMSASAGSLDAYLILLDASGEILTENDDDPGGVRDSLIEDYELPASGVYTIIATRYQRELGGTEGDFELRLDGVSAENTDSNPTPAALVQPEIEQYVTVNTTVAGVINPEQPIVYYGLMATAGQVINILTTDLDAELDILIMLLDPTGKPIAYNDDSSRFSNTPFLDNITLPMDGQYTILVVRSPHRPANATGEFEFFISEGQSADSLVAIYPEDITFGETVSAEIQRFGKEAAFTFYGTADEAVTFNIEPLEPRLARGTRVAPAHLLIHPAAGIVVSRGNDMRGNVTLPVDGYYILLVSARRGEGAINVTIDKG